MHFEHVQRFIEEKKNILGLWVLYKLVVNFIWNGKKRKIKKDTLIGPEDKGGLELPDYEIITKSLQCVWVKRMKEGIRKQRMEIPSFYLENVGGTFHDSFDCDYDLRLLNLSNMPAFYIDIRHLKQQTSPA